jgi:hypothetical protein
MSMAKMGKLFTPADLPAVLDVSDRTRRASPPAKLLLSKHHNPLLHLA